MINRPDKWLLLEIQSETQTFLKVFGVWSGSYLCGDSWRMNSGIVSVEKSDKDYTFVGYSGSRYTCSKDMYGTTAYGSGVLQEFVDKHGKLLRVLSEEEAMKYCEETE